MNCLHQNRQHAIRSAYDARLSVRAASAQCGVSRGTVERYYRRWQSQDFGGELTCLVKAGTKQAFRAEAERREMSVRGLLSALVETVAEDNLFSAVLDG